LRVYSQSQIKPPYATQYSVFTLYYINLHNMFRPLMVAILKCNYNHIQRLSLLLMDTLESGLVSMVYYTQQKLYVSINKFRCWNWSSLAADSQSTSSSGYRASPWGPRPDFILLFFFRLTITLFVILGCPLWRENGSIVCSTITHWSQLLYFTILSETAFPFCRLLRRAGTTVEVF
jgi:hypothetical protein